MGTLHTWMPLIRTGTGSEVYTRSLAAGLQRRGIDVTVSEAPHAYQYAPWLAPIQPPASAEVVLANSWNAAAFTRFGLPIVSVCHLVVHDERLRRYKSLPQTLFHRYFVLPMERASARNAAVNVAVSPMVARQMKVWFEVDNVVTVNNGVDTEYFTPGPVQEHQSGNPLQLLFVGKPSLRKGFDIVAEIVERLGDRVAFTCAGGPPESGLPRPDGRYTGYLDRESLREEYRKADLLLFPSRMEGFGLVAAEAMACGLPVLAAPNSALDDIVGNAMITPASEHVGSYVDTINALLSDQARLQHIAEYAQQCVKEAVSLGGWIGGMERALRNAV